ncbi:MAG: hypothetical protein NVS1B11_26080 [Terriglobales bacterium]
MEYHLRKPQKSDYRMGRECQFCSSDPDFKNRPTLDRQVHAPLGDTASAHITEDGYVWHRMLEVRRLVERSKAGAMAA